MKSIVPFAFAVLLTALGGAFARDKSAVELRPVYADGFEHGADKWRPVGGSEWRVIDKPGGGRMYRMTGKTHYKTKVRSPRIISLVRDVHVTDFDLTVTVQSTGRNYGHRDVCLFFGVQDPTHYYYVHFGQKADPHACQVFIVNNKPRTKITKKESKGTPWTDKWHTLKISRRAAAGTIEVYFDDMTTPMMTARDTTFPWGQVGLGTFDDSGNWDDFKLVGVKAPPPNRFEKAIRAFEDRDLDSPPPAGAALFVGSSSIKRWTGLASDFPGRAVIGRGFGGSQFADLLHFTDRIVLPYKPKTILVYEGDNDTAAGKKPEKIRDDFKTFVARVRAALPDARVHFIAIKPSLRRWRLWPEMKKANDLIRAFAKKTQGVTFLDVAGPMLGEDGKPRKGLFAKDGLHLSPAGYKLWTSLVQKAVWPAKTE